MAAMVPRFPFTKPLGLVLDPVYAQLRHEEPVKWVEFLDGPGLP